MKEYKVRYNKDDTWIVVEIAQNDEITNDIDDFIDDETVVFSGRLADCEAYIRLNEEGYM